MKSNIQTLVLAVFCITFFTACPKRVPNPTPRDTISSYGNNGGTADGGYGKRTANGSENRNSGNNGDFVRGNDVFEGDLGNSNFGTGGNDSGLKQRGSDFSLNPNDSTLPIRAFYDKDGNPIEVFDANGNELTPNDVFDSSIRGFDSFGNPITVFDGLGNPLNAYDANGNPITVYDAEGNVVSPYDASGKLRKLFDANENPVRTFDRNGKALPSKNPFFGANRASSNGYGGRFGSGVNGAGGSALYSQDQVLASVYFEFDQFFISNEARSALENLSRQLQSKQGASILLLGHCDWRGTTEYNTVLGDKRANSVREYLSNLGINATMETLSRGDLDALEGGSKTETKKTVELTLFQRDKHLMNKPKVLILCTGNSCRSHIAEGILRKEAKGLVDVCSAGSNPAGYVHPMAIEVMQEIGIDISAHTSKHLDTFLEDDIHTVVTVCGNADQVCPTFPGTSIASPLGLL